MAVVPADPAPARPVDPTVAVPSAGAPTPDPAAAPEVALAAERPTNHQELFIRGNCFQGRISQQGTLFGHKELGGFGCPALMLLLLIN